MAKDFRKRDLWWEARQKNAAKYKSLSLFVQDLLFKAKTVSYALRPTKTVFAPGILAQRPDVVIMPDFNKYRVRDLKPYIDAGCKAFLFRMGGPFQWVMGDPKYTRDATWYDYMEQAAKYGVLGQVIGYIVHYPFEDLALNSVSKETIHTQLVDEWTQGGYMPAAFMYDHEVATCWDSLGNEKKITVPNLIKSLDVNTDNTYKKFRRTVSIYSANWFMKTWGWTEHDTYFHNVNLPESQGGPGTQRPLINAWYTESVKGPYSNITPLLSDLLVPTPQQVSAYLYCGYQANGWQFTNRLKIGDDTVGVDCTISLDPFKQFFNLFGLQEPGATNPQEPPEEPGEPGDYVTQEQFALHLADPLAHAHRHDISLTVSGPVKNA